MYPLPSRPPVKKTKKTEYFVITVDEVIHQKKEAAAYKIKQEEIKQQKRLERERKRSEKIIKKATKTNTKRETLNFKTYFESSKQTIEITLF